MGTNCAPLVADLFLFCYERDFILSLSEDNQSGVIEKVGRNPPPPPPPETDSIKFKISPKTPRGKKNSTKRHHHRHQKRQPGEQQFPI